MKKIAAVLFLIGLSAALVPALIFAAQSTADVPATEELKAKARAEVLAGVQVGGSDTDYRIGVGDILGISVYGEGDMAVAPVEGMAREDGAEAAKSSGSGVQVRIDGKVSLRHIGDVEAAGLTLTQLADYLKIIYATVFDDPVVTTVLVQSNSQRYTVMGKVTTPGVFQLDYPVTIVQAIARSGGFTEWANSKITLVRKDSPKDKLFDGNTFKFDYDGFMKGKNLERNILVRPGDTLIVH